MMDEKIQETTKVNSTTTKKKEVQKEHTQNIEDIKYSGFWVRGAGYIIDGFIVGTVISIVIIPIAIIVDVITSAIDFGPLTILGQVFINLFGLMIAWGYFIFMTYKYQATLGKMAIGVKVTNMTGRDKLTLGKVALRETIGKLVSSFLFGIGYIMVAFTQKKQGLHDIIADSTVVYKNPKKGANVVAVVIAYVLWALIAFFVFVLMIIFMGVIIVMFSGLLQSGQNGVDYFNDFENTMIQNFDGNHSDKYDNNMMMDDMYNEMPMNYR